MSIVIAGLIAGTIVVGTVAWAGYSYYRFQADRTALVRADWEADEVYREELSPKHREVLDDDGRDD